MLTMIIADDEYNVREGLRNIIAWHEYGIQVVDVASDGLEALDLCLQHKPDILFTDIRMPMMDGLEVALKLKELACNTRIIIISGAQDFNYAKTALEVNAEGYILKPVKLPELKEVVHKVANGIRLERNREETAERLKQQIKENLPVLREKFLNSLVHGYYRNKTEFSAKARFLQIPMEEEERMSAAVLRIDNYEQAITKFSEEHKHLIGFSLLNICDEILAAYKMGFAFSSGENEFVLFLKQPASTDTLAETCEEIVKCLNTFLKLTVSIGLGSLVNGLFQAPISYKEALAALEHTFYTGNNSIIHIQDIKPSEEHIDTADLFFYQGQLVNSMKIGDTANVEETLELIFQRFIEVPQISVEYAQGICIELVYIAFRTLFETKDSAETILGNRNQFIQTIHQQHNVMELKALITAMFARLSRHYSNKVNLKNAKIIEKIKGILEQQYNQSLSIKKISEEIYLSPNYISLIFKQETGKTVMEYLTEIRIEAAKHLLRTTDMKILEVSETVGYENATYFSTLFKKHTGMHPAGYRSL